MAVDLFLGNGRADKGDVLAFADMRKNLDQLVAVDDLSVLYDARREVHFAETSETSAVLLWKELGVLDTAVRHVDADGRHENIFWRNHADVRIARGHVSII